MEDQISEVETSIYNPQNNHKEVKPQGEIQIRISGGVYTAKVKTYWRAGDAPDLETSLPLNIVKNTNQ